MTQKDNENMSTANYVEGNYRGIHATQVLTTENKAKDDVKGIVNANGSSGVVGGGNDIADKLFSKYLNDSDSNNNYDYVNVWDILNQLFPNYVLMKSDGNNDNNDNNDNNQGAKKNETAIKVGVVDSNMDVDKIDIHKKTDIPKNSDMDMYAQIAMPTVEQKMETELEKSEFPVWGEGIDRFTTWLAKPNISPSSLMSSTKKILEQLNQSLITAADHTNELEQNNNDKKKRSTQILTYVCYRNLLLCRIVLSEYQTSEFQIGVYLDKSDGCLLDVQELSGEHFTFAHFLHVFKIQLQQQEIIDTSTPELLDNYGITMAIDLDGFDDV